MKEIKIQSSKIKVIPLFLGSVLFVFIGIWMFQSSPGDIINRFMAVVGVIFFGIGAIYLFIVIFDIRPMLIINDQGITNNSSAVSIGLIEWKNIKSVGFIEIYGQKMLKIEIDDINKILAKKPGWKKFLLNLNKNQFGSPILISSNALKCDIQELYSILKNKINTR